MYYNYIKTGLMMDSAIVSGKPILTIVFCENGGYRYNLTFDTENLTWPEAPVNTGIFPEALDFIDTYGLGTVTGKTVSTEDGEFPIVHFNMDVIEEHLLYNSDLEEMYDTYMTSDDD